MTDVPEHLLARSRERRAAIGGGGDADAQPAATAAAAPAAGTAAGADVVPAAAAAAPAVVEATPPPPPPPYVQAALARPKVPKYAIGALAVLPLWGFIYFGTLVPKAVELDPQLALGRDVYTDNCASCHGASGQGGVGRPLTGVLEVFPDRADHIAWVNEGNADLAAGDPYGDPAAGRQAKTGGFNSMPAFKNSLSEEEIAAVVRYERETFGGEAPPAEGAAADGAAAEGSSGDK